MKLVGIGDNVVDYYEDQSTIYPGGNALNVTVISKRNGAEKNGYIGIIGDDLEARHVLEALCHEEIDTSKIRKMYGSNGKAYVALDENGDRVFKKTNRESRVQSKATLQFTNEDLIYLKEFDVIHTSINSNIEHELQRLSFKPISFDFSTKNKWNNEYLQKVCPFIQFAFFSGSGMSQDEIDSLMSYVHTFGVKIVVVTKGGDPAICSDGEKRYLQSPVETEIVDTMGAGDSFIAGFLTSYFNTNDVKIALRNAAISAGKTCEKYGAFGYGKRV
ncbi:PfkB family carbohydrate kinase [Bacillus sp. FJAT-29814]|uniref:PfkB family carbohydrate kinase n=1 Tax=Bacillus sp. FJAT-29814 TaxID=1729688 RepID=UPI00082B34A0|nr:PfkB family carbohydrate kinase [Bacillus sp. FJAT-29814]